HSLACSSRSLRTGGWGWTWRRVGRSWAELPSWLALASTWASAIAAPCSTSAGEKSQPPRISRAGKSRRFTARGRGQGGSDAEVGTLDCGVPIGIIPGAMAIKRDYYEILGVERAATDDEIRRAFRRAAQRHHPDVDKTDGAEQRFKELNEAYRVLSDRQRRQAYDMFGHAGVDGASTGGFEGFGGGFGPFGDIFDAS